MPEPQHLFVYGTLLRIFAHDHARLLRAHCRFVGAGRFEGRLLMRAPIRRLSPSRGRVCSVRGELYRVIRPHLLFPILDSFEGCGADDDQPHRYRREAIEIRLDAGRKVSACVYLYNRDTDLSYAPSHAEITRPTADQTARQGVVVFFGAKRSRIVWRGLSN